jgi:hypothetical protein
MRRALFLLLAVVTAPADDAETRWRALVADLGDSRFEVREKAQEELIRAGESARAFLRKAMDETADPEVRMRLKEILQALGRARWAPGLKAGVEESRRSGRPLLVVSADGPEAAAAGPAGLALRALLKDETLFPRLSERFVLVWWDASVGQNLAAIDPASVPMPPEGFADEEGRVGFYFCTARGTVRHFLPGAWSPATLLAEAERADAMLAATDAGQALKTHAEARRAVEAEAAALASGQPEAVLREGSPEKARLDALKLLSASYVEGSEVLGEPVETYLANRLKDLQARHPAR